MTTLTTDAPGAVRALHFRPSSWPRPSGSAGRLPCEGSPELWFAEHGHHLDRAKAACAPCPLRAACLGGALERREPAGVWGGEIFVDGAVVATKRGRGRPPRAHRLQHR